VRHLAQCALFTGLQIPDISASSGTTFYFFHQPYQSGTRLKLLRIFLNTLTFSTSTSVYFAIYQLQGLK